MIPGMRVGAAVLVGILVLAGIACGDKITVPPAVVTPTPSPVVRSVTVTPGAATLNVGERLTLAASVNADAGITDRTVTWSSSNASIASVDVNGVVTAVGPGNATITATSRADATVKGAAIVTVVGTPTASILVTPTSLTFTHTVGTTTCPQAIGTFTIQNTGTVPLNTTISSGNPALTVTPASAVIPAGGSQQVTLAFNCGTQNAFTTTVTIQGSSGGNTVTGAVQVTANINR